MTEISAVLEGGPDTLPSERRTCRVRASESKVKVPHYGGYEHFERGDGVIGDDGQVVFRWTGRTRVAE